MLDEPRVSILLPVRDAAATLPACINSLERQTFRGWECLAVDDRSTDESRALLDAWAARDPRVRVLATRAPAGGIVVALEEARACALGELIARQDADDESLPERLARQVQAMEADPDLAALGCQTAPAGEPTDGMRRYLDWLAGCTDPAAFEREIWIESAIVHPTAMIRATWLDMVGGYRDLPWPEDYDLWLRIHRAGGRIANLPDRLYRWTDRPDRLSRRDPRYAPAAFLACRLHHMRRWLAERGIARPLVVWGAGRDGRRLARAWEAELHAPGPGASTIAAFVDIDPRKLGRNRRGKPILPFEAARRDLPDAFYLAAVGADGAREQIRATLTAAGLRETLDFICLH